MSSLSSSLIIYPDQAWLLENQLSPGGNRAERFFSLRNDGLVAGIQPTGQCALVGSVRRWMPRTTPFSSSVPRKVFGQFQKIRGEGVLTVVQQTHTDWAPTGHCSPSELTGWQEELGGKLRVLVFYSWSFSAKSLYANKADRFIVPTDGCCFPVQVSRKQTVQATFLF